MSAWYPDFYPAFRCRAAECRHSCCRGWEIDVDEASAEGYRELPGELGDALRAALFADQEGWHFLLTEEERCPFLQKDGLCRLILQLGEEALCDICALHPRFFQEIGEDELWGLGLSCEAATALLLERDALRFTCDETGENADLPGLLERLGIDLPPALLRYAPRINERRRRELLRRFRDTEPIDEAWPRELDALKAAPLPETVDAARYQRIYEYLFFHQIEKLEDEGAERVAAYAGDMTDLLALWDARVPDTAGHLRRLSEQIEYSTENVERLIQFGIRSSEFGIEG
ncbi:MAG: flagellin lysine-N-methylase [Oscillospiraceae bacterium]|nr:flagellin lysine-N-methylase [Oscillospiraceae bacterium]MBR3474790.1 flagellin lysine-N-methylase [Oscillospiraceae bacterium]